MTPEQEEKILLHLLGEGPMSPVLLEFISPPMLSKEASRHALQRLFVQGKVRLNDNLKVEIT